MQLYLLTAVSAIAGLADAAANANGFCGVERSILSSLHEVPTASAFCSKYLGIKTCTVTSTKTKAIPTTTVTVQQTATSATTVVSVTSTEQTSISSTTTTFTVTTQDTTTSTTTATYTYDDITATCLSTGTTFTPTQQAASPTGPVKRVKEVKRAGEAELTPDCLKPSPSASISKACSCLSIPTPSTTTVVTKIVRSGAATSTATIFVEATSTATATAVPVTTLSTTVTVTQTPVTVIVETSTTAPPAQPTLNGVSWYWYPSSFNDAGGDVTQFDPSIFENNPNYEFSGSNLENVNSLQSLGYPAGPSICLVPSQDTYADCSQVAVVFEGFLYATQGAGTYTLSSSGFDVPMVDNVFYVWSGENAYSNLTKAAADYVAYNRVQSGSISYTLVEGEFRPISMMWANTGGSGQASVQITTPDGVLNYDTTNFFMPPCIDSPFSP